MENSNSLLSNLKNIKNNSLSVYVHIPFCTEKCSYCDFYSETNVPRDLKNKIVLEIINQFKFLYSYIGNPKIKTIYIGGGTPSLLGAGRLNELLKALSIDAGEITVEANPESISKEFINTCIENNVKRISLGIQSFQNNLLKVLKRRASKEDNLRACELLNTMWTGDVSLDFIAGIPGQTKENIIKDIQTGLKINPAHISLYSLTITDGTNISKRIHNKELVQNPEEYQEELWFSAREYLLTQGFNQYEISNYAKSGHECRHNLAYWNMDPYLGIGPGAVGTMPGGPTGIMRISNPENLNSYLKGRQEDWNVNIDTIPTLDFLFENLIMGFRLKSGINNKVFKKRFGFDLMEILGPLWKKWSDKGYADRNANDEFYSLSDEGRLVLNRLLEEVRKCLYAEPVKLVDVNWPG